MQKQGVPAADDGFTILEELNDAVVETGRESSHDLLRADDSIQWERFDAEEWQRLYSMPDSPFDARLALLGRPAEGAKYGRNFQVTAGTQRYSPQFALAGKLPR